MALVLPTVASVRVLTSTALCDPEIQDFIDDAAAMVEKCVAGLSATLQKTIIKYVAAHLIATSGAGGGDAAQITSRKLGDASRSYARAQTGTFLAGTSFGQQAMALDPNGCLANLGKPGITFEVL